MTISGWQLERLSGPDLEPVTVAEVKIQCKIDADQTIEDEALADDISAARELAEDYCHQTWCPTLWRLTLMRLPGWHDPIQLPMGPLLELVSVTYLDSHAVRQTLDLTTLEVSLASKPPWIRGFWPSDMLVRAGAVQIDYWAGYPVEGSPAVAVNVPKRVKKAVKMLVAHWYANRESVVAETRITPVDVPYSFERALDQLKEYP